MSTNDWTYDESENFYSEESMSRQGDPPPILSNARPSTIIVLHKELTGYPNYGNPSGNADILYTGNVGSWTFNLPNYLFLLINNFERVRLILRGALDDHYDVPENRYNMTVNFNGSRQNFGRLPFVHGRPRGQQFDNWRQLAIDIPTNILRRNNTVQIRNTSNAGDTDFIALDWMELRFFF
ncbi:hypothetical protein RDV78_10725 [Bacillota bacterium LX-D]|nr:hypothetical protein [Bacillota bacterium LX-D]